MDGKSRAISSAYFLACVIAALAPFAHPARESRPEYPDFPGWPASLDGKRLTELALSPNEDRFFRRFPGRAAKFTNGESQIILRWITEPSRKLHPAADCFRATGYAIRPKPIWQDSTDHRWNVFEASRNGATLRVYERIFDHDGRQWPDVSSWYWSALLGRTRGPWWAVTYVRSS